MRWPPRSAKIANAAHAIPNENAERNPATAHMFIINPLSGQRMDNLFSTHPATENRIAALERAGAARWARVRWIRRRFVGGGDSYAGAQRRARGSVPAPAAAAHAARCGPGGGGRAVPGGRVRRSVRAKASFAGRARNRYGSGESPRRLPPLR